MTSEEIDLCLSNLTRAGAPKILVLAAKVLFEAGWHNNDVGTLIVTIAATSRVVATQEDAEALVAADGSPNKALN